MQVGALRPYDRALTLGQPLRLRHVDGRVTSLDVPRWLAAADAADRTVVERCHGPVLDIGCGPGRMLAALHEQALSAMGIDIAESALTIARRQGLPAVKADVLTTTIDRGCWRTALLLDGNIGIGGDPRRLLGRVKSLLHSDGQVLVEVHPNARANFCGSARFAAAGAAVGPSFPWAEIGIHALVSHAHRAGLVVCENWSHGLRRFVRLRPLA